MTSDSTEQRQKKLAKVAEPTVSQTTQNFYLPRLDDEIYFRKRQLKEIEFKNRCNSKTRTTALEKEVIDGFSKKAVETFNEDLSERKLGRFFAFKEQLEK